MSSSRKVSAVVTLVLVAILLAVWFSLSSLKDKPGTLTVDVSEIADGEEWRYYEILQVKEDDLVIGNPDALVAIVSYDSFSCHHCANFYTFTFQAVREYVDAGKAYFVHRDFPLDRVALFASRAVACYRGGMVTGSSYDSSEKFFKLILSLYHSQNDWVMSSAYKEKVVDIVLSAGGVSRENLLTCLENEQKTDKIVEDTVNAGKVLGINATPSVFVNDTLVPIGKLGIGDFRGLIERELSSLKTD